MPCPALQVFVKLSSNNPLTKGALRGNGRRPALFVSFCALKISGYSFLLFRPVCRSRRSPQWPSPPAVSPSVSKAAHHNLTSRLDLHPGTDLLGGDEDRSCRDASCPTWESDDSEDEKLGF